MENKSSLALLMDLRGLIVAMLLGLFFGLINVLITLSILSIWTSLIFPNVCNISLLFDYSFGKLPYIHLTIIGVPLTVLAGVTTAMLTYNFIKNRNDALIMGGMTGIISSILPYGSTWALLLLFADYWMNLPPYVQYFLLVFLGVVLFTPLAAWGSYYYSKDKLKAKFDGITENGSGNNASIPVMFSNLKIPSILVLITILTIIIPLVIAFIFVQMGYV